MKKKETIQILKDFNEWRRGLKGYMPDPKDIGIAIDNAISTLEAKGGYIEYENSYKRKYKETHDVLYQVYKLIHDRNIFDK